MDLEPTWPEVEETFAAYIAGKMSLDDAAQKLVELTGLPLEQQRDELELTKARNEAPVTIDF